MLDENACRRCGPDIQSALTPLLSLPWSQVTNKDALATIIELTGVAIKVRGIHVPPGRKPNPGERKLHVVGHQPLSKYPSLLSKALTGLSSRSPSTAHRKP